MRKTVPYLAAWFITAVAAVGLASAGVAVVGQQVTDSSRKAPLSAEQVREELAAEAAPTTTTTMTTTVAAPTTTAGGTSPTTGGDGGPGSGPSRTGGATTTVTTPAPPPPPAASSRTDNLVGGTVTLRFSAAGVKVLSAVPNAGFSVEKGTAHDNGARVEFESEDHRSRVEGWWDGGPRDEVREDD